MHRYTVRSIAAAAGSALALGLGSVPALANWTQWGQNPQHTGVVGTVGQGLNRQLADIVYDPFVAQEQAASNGDLLAHYQAPLVDGNDVFMEFESGTYTPKSASGRVWSEKRLTWQNGQLVTAWTYDSDWQPEPFAAIGGWEPVFHAVLVDPFVYVPAAGGNIVKLNRADGSVAARINPFGDDLNPSIFVAGPLTADKAGNVFYNALKLNPTDPWGKDVEASWLAKVSPSGATSKVLYTSLVPGAPTSCTATFGASQLPWPPSPDAVPATIDCGSQRPGVNVAPAIAPDGTIYTVSRAHFASRYAYVVAVKPDLTSKWAASMRDRLNDGCGVSEPIGSDPSTGTVIPGACRAGAHVGVDPATNQAPAGRVIDQSSSSPSVMPDGSVLYGAYARYNYARGHLFKFSATGAFLAAYNFGWDSTPAVTTAGQVVIKDNHYDVGSYCNSSKWCPTAPGGPYYITQLNPDLTVQWQFKSTNTQSCSRNPDGTLNCTSDHPNGFEWCINAPAIDANGVVYANSEDGNLYSINPNGTEKQHIFLNLAIGAAYTPLSIGDDGKIYTENDGHLFVVGN